MSIPSPQPEIVPPLGVYGSLKRIFKHDLTIPAIRGGAPVPKNVTFDERPAQSEMYPTVNIKSDPTDLPEYHFENGKTKRFHAIIEVYAVSLEEAELLGEAVERSLELGSGPTTDGTSAAARIASMLAISPDCVEIIDMGGEKYESEKDWGPSSLRTHMGTLHYAITIRRTF